MADASFTLSSSVPAGTETANAPAGSYAIKQVVSADYSCVDCGSGLASCSGTTANGSPIDTAAPETKSYTVTAERARMNACQCG